LNCRYSSIGSPELGGHKFRYVSIDSVKVKMSETLDPQNCRAVRVAPSRRRTAGFQPATTLALVILFAVAVIAISIGIAQADTLGEVMASDTGRLALLGLVFLIVAAGGITATVMWLTAPTLPRRRHLHRI
jgi:hypothetical protein